MKKALVVFVLVPVLVVVGLGSELSDSEGEARVGNFIWHYSRGGQHVAEAEAAAQAELAEGGSVLKVYRVCMSVRVCSKQN